MHRTQPTLARVGLVLSLSLWVCSGLLGCQASRKTNQLTFREGPPLNVGRMSSSLGAVKLRNGRVIVVGGSPTEFPFKPVTGPNTVEILDTRWSRWSPAGIDIAYPLSGAAFELPDGRIFAFAAVYDFNPNSTLTTPNPPDKDHPQTGAVSAAIIDLDKKSFTPIYRARNNDLSAAAKPLTGSGIALVQRAFAKSLQLSDGRIVRIGGRVLQLSPPPTVKCEQKRCRYCQGTTCTPHTDGDYTCEEASSCPELKGTSEQKVLSLIEIYTPPKAPGSLGQVKRVFMDEARRNANAIELLDGRVFITGGKGPLGQGVGQVFDSTYLLNPDTGELRKGPRMFIGREDHSMARLEDGRVLITGGSNRDERSVNLTEIFNPQSQLFIDGDPMDTTREDHQPVRLGPWVLFLGGEDSGKSDLIRNSGEAFDATTGIHIASFFLFARENTQTQTQLCPNTNGFAGIDDFAALALDKTHVMLLGGQQGCQDRDGDYISPGKGSRRTLFVELPQ